MAFDLSTWATAKYRFTAEGSEGTTRIIEIHEDGFASSVTTVDGTGRGSATTNYSADGADEYAPFQFSETTVSVYDNSLAIAGDLIGQINTVADKYLVVIRDGNTLRWVGRIDPEGITYNEDGPVPLTISAVDGLGRLDSKPYITATDGTGVDTGETTFVEAIADALSGTGYGLDFYVSSSLLHKTSPALGATDNPLENTWFNKIALTSREGDNTQAVISKLSVIRTVCEAWGLVCFQADGAWHFVQANHRGANTYRRWRYDSTGSPKIVDSHVSNVYEDFNPRVTVGSSINRTTSTASFLKGYNSSIVQYQHGPIELLRYSGFEPQSVREAEAIFGGTYPWTRSAPDAQFFSFDDGSWGMGILSVDDVVSNRAGYEPIEVGDKGVTIANQDDTATGSNGAFATLIGNKKSSQTSATLQSGDTFGITFQAYGKSFNAAPRPDPQTATPEWIAFQVYNEGTSEYLEWGSDGSLDWTSKNTWLLMRNRLPMNGWFNVALKDIEATTGDGAITITLGPVLYDESGSEALWGQLIWDNVQLFPILADGTVNYEATSVVNYINRGEPRPVKRSVIFGDGPTKYNKGSMFSDSGLTAITEDWEETTSGHSGTDTNEDHATVLGTAMLTSMNKVREVHSGAYPGYGDILTPLNSLNRASGNYVAWNLTVNWIEEYSSGSWYLSDENIFINDLETGITSGASVFSDLGKGVGADSGYNYNRIGSSFDTLIARESDRLATVSADATSLKAVSCTALAEDLNDGDTVFFQSVKRGNIIRRVVDGDVSAGATSFDVTVAFSASEAIDSGDPILPGTITGMRIDMDGISIINTHIKNDGTSAWNGVVSGTGNITTPGTQGWIITRRGQAEFNDVTVRGKIVVGAGSSGIETFGDAGPLVTADDIDDVPDGTTYGRIAQTIIEGGLIQVGTGTKDTDLDGFHISGTEIVGQASGVDQVVMNTSGQIVAGDVTMDLDGILIDSADGDASFRMRVAGDTNDALRITASDGGVGTGKYAIIENPYSLISLQAYKTGGSGGSATINMIPGGIFGQGATASGVVFLGDRLVVEGAGNRITGEVALSVDGSADIDRYIGVGMNCIFTKTSTTTLVSDATEQPLSGTGEGTKTIPEDMLGVGTTVRVRATGYYKSASQTIAMRVKIGGTAWFFKSFNLASTSTNNEGWYIDAEITVRTAGASGTAIGQGRCYFEDQSSTGREWFAEDNTSTISIDTTTTNAIDVTADWTSSSANDSISCTNMTIEVLRPVAS